MTARRDKSAHDDARHQESSAHEHVSRGKHDDAEQGVVEDERGQEQPADKKRAVQNR